MANAVKADLGRFPVFMAKYPLDGSMGTSFPSIRSSINDIISPKAIQE
jgi:hypothetical protein